MSRFRIRTLKVRLIISIFVIITSVYALIGLLMLLAYHGDLFNIENLYHTGRFGMLLMIVLFFMISVIIGFLAFYRFNQIFLKPLNELSTALKEVEKGNYNIVVSTDVRIRELHRLMQGFNRMTKEISSAQLLKKDFISYFSHEFKTPITSIRGFSRQIKERELDPKKQKEYIDIIYQESNRLINMSSNVLTLTKLEHQGTLTDKKVFSLDEQLRKTLLLLEKQWTEKALELVLELEEIEIDSNEEMVKQIWVNVISNAIQYSHQRGQLKIQCKKDGKFAKIRIRDEGTGMPDQVRERIFEKFYQGDASHGTSGNGLGMSIVKRIIDLCGGKIVIKSQLKKGTVVIIYLPLEEKVRK
ncbi:MAG: HAMP domain-containing histidine kinase [Defluviitaleaceae bacterium]|nr:HAMP domain-containing histidine kinase [Defluviitaleaceae bacterium]